MQREPFAVVHFVRAENLNRRQPVKTLLRLQRGI